MGRELAAFAGLFRRAVRERQMVRSPLAVRQVAGRNGEVISVPEAAPQDVRPSNVHWLTPRTWRRWIDVGLRGHTRGGVSRLAHSSAKTRDASSKGVRLRNLDQDDLPVLVQARRGWVRFMDRVSLACVELVPEALFGGGGRPYNGRPGAICETVPGRWALGCTESLDAEPLPF
ncbi:hypothetical protein ABZ614_42355 [Streptomyces sp. NPDC013178]|uniref:hypothetical protein n=1 Tax=Streptomyces sp. NPDC013178 TaxID=3155118 RepID=UPI0033D9985E